MDAIDKHDAKLEDIPPAPHVRSLVKKKPMAVILRSMTAAKKTMNATSSHSTTEQDVELPRSQWPPGANAPRFQ